MFIAITVLGLLLAYYIASVVMFILLFDCTKKEIIIALIPFGVIVLLVKWCVEYVIDTIYEKYKEAE